MIPSNISKEHILTAINEVKNSTEGIPINRISVNYDLEYEGNKYPPKYIISLANKYANNEELVPGNFLTTEARSFLKKLNFIVNKRNPDKINVWIEKTDVQGRPDRISGEYAFSSALWSPTRSRDGKDIYKNMREVKKGDLVLHLIDHQIISGISIVEDRAKEVAVKLETDYDGNCYVIKLINYNKFNLPIKKEEIFASQNWQKLRDISNKSEVFYTKDFTFRQGAYLTPCINELLILLNTIYKNSNGENMPYIDELINMEDEGEMPGNVTSQENNKQIPKNMILYGPPGTGKTYNTVNYAVAIIENKDITSVIKEKYEDVLGRYKIYKEAGRIVFSTFHQSYGYEEFIEGIKPVLEEDDNQTSDIKYECRDGIFKKLCKRAEQVKINTNSIGINEDSRIWNVTLGGNESPYLKKECFKNNYIKINWKDKGEFITEETEGLSKLALRILLNFQDEMKEGDIVFIFKDIKSIDAIGVIDGPYEFDEGEYPRKRKVKWIATDINENIYQMNNNTQLDVGLRVYELKKIDLKNILELIDKYLNSNKLDFVENSDPYVLIIDEINRGNISKIFGELITLIECSKRAGEPESASAILPYSGEEFSVPNNVYIVGTMNTADRSIALLDTALRRRFDFIEIMPNPNILNIIPEIEGINIAQLLKKINQRIECLFDREHTIGHAYFTSLEKNPTLNNLANIFKNSIIPLLQEYFYEDYSKIQLVLGDNGKAKNLRFILDSDIDTKLFKENSDIDLPDKIFSINNEAFYNPESYIAI